MSVKGAGEMSVDCGLQAPAPAPQALTSTTINLLGNVSAPLSQQQSAALQAALNATFANFTGVTYNVSSVQVVPCLSPNICRQCMPARCVHICWHLHDTLKWVQISLFQEASECCHPYPDFNVETWYTSNDKSSSKLPRASLSPTHAGVLACLLHC